MECEVVDYTMNHAARVMQQTNDALHAFGLYASRGSTAFEFKTLARACDGFANLHLAAAEDRDELGR